MKKLISILLVPMLIIGMFPATTLTAFAADTQIEFALGANGSASHADGTSKTTYTETVNGYTLTLTNPSNMYTGARDAKGNSCIKLGATSKAGGFSFTVPGDVTSVVIAVGKYKTNTTKVSINGTTTTLTKNSNDGAYDAITVDTTSNKTVTLTTVSGGYRAMVNTITFIIPGGSTEPDEPACQHPNTELQNEAEASCTTDGYTGDEVCLDCGETVTEGEVIPAAHTYVGGICSVCGEAEPAGYVLVNSAGELKAGDQVIIVATNANYAMGVSKGNNHGGASVVKGDTIDPDSTVLILTLENTTVSGTFALKSPDGYLYAASSGSNYLKTRATNTDANGYWTISIANSIATIKATGSYTRNWIRYNPNNGSPLFSCYGSGQQDVSIYKLSGGTTESCQHTNTEPIPAVAATCSEGGWTEGVKCSDCGEILTAPTATAVRPHNFVDGICAYEDCGMYEHQAELMTTLPGNGDKIIIHHVKNNLALGLEVVQSNDLAGISTTPVDGKLTYYTSVAQLTVGLADGEYTFQNANGGYLTTDEGNALYFAEALTDNGKWNIALEDGKFIIDNAYATNDTGTLTLEVYGGAFTSYSYGNNNPTDAYKMHLYLVEKGEDTCLHPNAYELDDGYAAQCGVPGMTNSWYCPDCEITTVPQETIPALEHNFVNGTCTNDGCGAQDPLYTLPGRYYIAATRNNGSYYMTSDLGTSSTKRYTAVETGLETLPTEITDPAFGYVFIVTRNEDGTFSIQAEGIPGDNYLGWSSGNSGILTADKNINFTATANEDGTFTFANSANRYLSLNNSGDDWFAWYESVQKRDLTLIPVTGAETAPAASADGRYFATAEEAIAAAAEEGQTVTLLAAAGNVQVTGDLVIDLNGNSIASLTISGTLKAYDSKATTAAASGAKIESVNAGEIVMDNTVDDVRYITLNDNGIYSFHALELTLTAVTLRTRGVDENGAAIPGAGLYYKAAIVCDPTLAAYVNENREACSFGLVLSLVNMPGSDFMTETEDAYTVATAELESSKVFTSGILNNIFKHGLDAEENATRGKDNIYANAYLNLNGTIYMADTTANDTADAENFDGAVFSLMTVMQALDTSYATMEDSNPHKALLLDFYTKWYDAMDDWGLDNLNADYVPPVAE